MESPAFQCKLNMTDNCHWGRVTKGTRSWSVTDAIWFAGSDKDRFFSDDFLLNETWQGFKEQVQQRSSSEALITCSSLLPFQWYLRLPTCMYTDLLQMPHFTQETNQEGPTHPPKSFGSFHPGGFPVKAQRRPHLMFKHHFDSYPQTWRLLLQPASVCSPRPALSIYDSSATPTAITQRKRKQATAPPVSKACRLASPLTGPNARQRRPRLGLPFTFCSEEIRCQSRTKKPNIPAGNICSGSNTEVIHRLWVRPNRWRINAELFMQPLPSQCDEENMQDRGSPLW